MAKIAEMPNEIIVSGFKGILDYYVWMGIPCVRSWPSRRTLPHSPAEQAQWPIFATAITVWTQADDETRAAYEKMAQGSTLSGRDIASKLYMKGTSIYRAIP